MDLDAAMEDASSPVLQQNSGFQSMQTTRRTLEDSSSVVSTRRVGGDEGGVDEPDICCGRDVTLSACYFGGAVVRENCGTVA